ncbi:hypothetical protein FACS1894132_10600 [Clostridia bacterium]|nr:hypothetical protein FACS1894132_10600 [Clostridia bacterium]
MKTLKRTLALIAALTVVATTFAACKDKDKDEKSSSSSTTTTGTSATTAAGETTTDGAVDPGPASAKPDDSAVTLKSGGANFTVVAWNPNDFPALLATFAGKVDQVSASDAAVNVDLLKGATTPSGAAINFVNLNVGSADAKQSYDNMLAGGEDIDIYAAEADFALDYIGDSAKSADFKELGYKESDWSNAYKYTLEIGKDANGALRGISWQACPGGYSYRTDLAKEYLGVETPEAMQAKVKDWDTMTATAAELSEKSGGKTAITATLGGIWQVYQPARDKSWVVDNKLVADDAKSLKFVSLAKEWIDKGYTTKVGQWSDAWKPLGQDGSTLGYFVSTWGFGDTILIGAAGGKGGASYGKWGLVTGPQGFFWGGTWFIVNPKTDNGIDAKDFIYELTLNEDTMAKYAKAKGEYMNNKKVMSAGKELANADISENFGGQDYISGLSAAAAAINIDSTKITKYDATIKADFITAVTDYTNGNYASVDATIKAFTDKVYGDIPSLTE